MKNAPNTTTRPNWSEFSTDQDARKAGLRKQLDRAVQEGNRWAAASLKTQLVGGLQPIKFPGAPKVWDADRFENPVANEYSVDSRDFLSDTAERLKGDRPSGVAASRFLLSQAGLPEANVSEEEATDQFRAATVAAWVGTWRANNGGIAYFDQDGLHGLLEPLDPEKAAAMHAAIQAAGYAPNSELPVIISDNVTANDAAYAK